MKCREFAIRLSPLLRGELEDNEQTPCEHHAADCPACRELLREGRALEQAVRQAAADDPARAGAALEDFEDHLLERWRRECRAAALDPTTTRRHPSRLGLGVSLALNLGTCGLLLALFLAPELRERLWMPPQGPMPAGLPSAARMQEVFGEFEALFGRRLGWIAETGGDVAMGIINDPDKVPPAQKPEGPLVALVYWLDGEEGRGGRAPLRPVVILTRSGSAIRQQVSGTQGLSPVEISVNSFLPRSGGFAIQTQVRPLEQGGQDGGGISSLAATVHLAPGQTAKLGEVRMGNRLYDSFLAVKVLSGAAGHGKES